MSMVFIYAIFSEWLKIDQGVNVFEQNQKTTFEIELWAKGDCQNGYFFSLKLPTEEELITNCIIR